jgi:hypothetical protein
MPTSQHHQTPEDPDIEVIEAVEAALEATGFAAMFDMAPRDLAILFVVGSTHAGSTIKLSAVFQQIADAADGNVRFAASLIARVADVLVRHGYTKALGS